MPGYSGISVLIVIGRSALNLRHLCALRTASEQLQNCLGTASEQHHNSFRTASEQPRNSFKTTSEQLQNSLGTTSEHIQNSFTKSSEQFQNSLVDNRLRFKQFWGRLLTGQISAWVGGGDRSFYQKPCPSIRFSPDVQHVFPTFRRLVGANMFQHFGA